MSDTASYQSSLPGQHQPSASAARIWPLLLAICVAAGALRFFILAEHLADNPFSHYLRVDAETYWDWAGRIAAGEWGDARPFFSAPLYPYLLGLVRACGGELAAVYTIQILLHLATAVLLARIGRARFGAPVGLLSAAVFLVMLEPTSYSLRVLPATLQLGLVCLAWLALLAAQRQPSLPRGLMAGGTLGLLALSSPPAMLCLPIFAVWWWWNTGRGLAAAGRAATAVLAGVVVIAPAAIHNYRACGELIPISAQAGITFAQGNAPGARGTYTALPGVSRNREIQNLDAFRIYREATNLTPSWKATSRFFFRRGLDYWHSQPLGAVELLATKAYWFLTARNYGDICVPAAEMAAGLLARLRCAPLPSAWLIPLALVAVAVWLPRSRTYLPELMLFGIPLLVVIVFFYSPRYRLPAIPVIVVGATWVLWQALRRWRSAWSVAATAAVVLAALLSSVNRATGFDSLASCQPEFECSLGAARDSEGKLEQAVSHYQKALALQPDLETAELGLANALRLTGQFEIALKHVEHVLAADPDSATAHNLAGILLAAQGNIGQATGHLRQAARIDKNMPDAHSNLANLLVRQGNLSEALEHYRTAVYLDPEFAPAHYGLGNLQLLRGDPAAAAAAFRQTLKLQPQHRGARVDLAYLLLSQQDYGGAAAVLREGCELAPDDLQMANDLAWLLATCPDPAVRSPEEALALATRVRQAMDQPDANKLDTLAAAYAAAGRFEEAVAVARQAIERATAAGDVERAERIGVRLRLYEAGKPFRDEP